MREVEIWNADEVGCPLYPMCYCIMRVYGITYTHFAVSASVEIAPPMQVYLVSDFGSWIANHALH